MNNMSETIEQGDVVPFDIGGNQSLAVALARSEVDHQVTTARALPRSIEKSVKGILTLATLDRLSAQECVYALPRSGKPIRGPSIRMAEIIASQWGNCRIGARVVHVDRIEKYVEAEGIFHDLESNTASTARVRRRLSDKSGKLLTDDMIVVTGNAACAIAKRNAILGGVPKAVWRNAYMKVEGVIAGDVQTLSVRRELAVKEFAHFGVKPDQIYSSLGVTGLADITIEHIITLAGMISALQNGEETVETLFSKASGEKPVIPNPLISPTPTEPEQSPFLERFSDALSSVTEATEIGQVLAFYDAELMEQDDAAKEAVRLAVNAKERQFKGVMQ